MKRFRFSMLAVLLSSTLLTIHEAPAAPKHGPVISPSVIAARRYKYNPPRNWIRHYLGDDRYKIAGGIWKYVTTPNDGYVYPPSAREMLARSPDDVIGFNSLEEVGEAGYVLHPAYTPALNAPTITVLPSSTGRKTSSISRRIGQRIALSDGSSSLILPNGWTRISSQAQNYNGVMVHSDMFRSPKGNILGISSMTMPNMPAGTDMGQYLTPQTMQRYASGYGSSGMVNNSVSNALNNVITRSVTLGGVRGIVMRPRSTAGLAPSQRGEFYMVARGSKMYMMFVQGSSRTPDVKTVIKSFRPR